MSKISLSTLLVGLVAALIAQIGVSGEAKYPSKPINIFIHAAPGGFSDTTARAVGPILSKELGVPIIYTNRTGAAGAVMLNYVRERPADGYTIGFAPNGLVQLGALGYAEEIKPDNFDLLCLESVAPAAITIRADLPYKTLAEFINAAKAAPGKFKCGTTGSGSGWHIAAKVFERKVGIQLNYVPFNGSSPTIAALMGGHIDLTTVSPMEVAPGLESGEFRMLAVMGSLRSPKNPDVPTLEELGYGRIDVVAFGSFILPKGVPQAVKDILSPAFEKAIKDPSFKKLADERDFNVVYMNAAAFKKYADEQYEFYKNLVKDLDL
jgi:tripartite-type tricarboxylate transporter receptor subunit TctC